MPIVTRTRTQVPVVTEGEDSCPGVKRGGFAWNIHKRLTVVCKAKDIPSDFTVDISKVRLLDGTNAPTFPFFTFRINLFSSLHPIQLRLIAPLPFRLSRADGDWGQILPERYGRS